MKQIYFIFFLIFISTPLFSQVRVVEGIIYGENKEVLPGATILLRSGENNKVISYGISDEAGRFRIRMDMDKLKDASITFSFLGFRTVTLNVDKTEQDFQVTLEPEAFYINEVLVKAPKIRAQGDTLVYNVGSYAREYDKTIGDVLKKLPGIEVKESGQINFNGAPINRFYIEGADLLQGRYGIATNSISSKDISVVEVLQDHQPIKALEGLSYSDRAAINLKLKENSKAKWIGTFRGGMGFTPLLWNGQLTGMRFTKKLQTLNTYKTNNTGSDFTREVASFDIRDMSRRSDRLPDYITLNPPQSLGLKRNRELFNRSHQLTTHNLTQLKNDFELRVSSVFTAHRETNEKTTETIYYEAEGEPIQIEDKESSVYHRKNLAVGITLEGNKPGYNLTNRLNGNFNWTDREIDLTGTYPNQQEARSPNQQFTNDLHLLKRFGKNFLTIESTVAYQNNPQELRISQVASRQSQDVKQSGWSTDNKIGYGFTLGNIVSTFTAGIAAMERSLETHLTGVDIEGVNTFGNTRLGYVRPYVFPKFEYRFWKFITTLKVPINLSYYHYTDKNASERLNNTFLQVNPGVNINLKLNNNARISLTGEMGKSEINEKVLFPAAILGNYRFLSEGMTRFTRNTRKSLSVNLAINRPLNELFCNLSARHSWNEVPFTVTQSFVDQYILTSYLRENNSSNSWMITGSVNKGISNLNCNIYLTASYQKKSSFLIRNETKISSKQDNFTLSPRIETNLSRFFVLNYQLNYNHSQLRVVNNDKKERSDLSQTLFIRVLPSTKFNIILREEHYCNEISEINKKNFFFSDVSATYKLNKKTEFTLDVNNLFNQESYSYLSLMTDATSVYYNYSIRPRNILLSTYIVF